MSIKIHGATGDVVIPLIEAIDLELRRKYLTPEEIKQE